MLHSFLCQFVYMSLFKAGLKDLPLQLAQKCSVNVIFDSFFFTFVDVDVSVSQY